VHLKELEHVIKTHLMRLYFIW